MYGFEVEELSFILAGEEVVDDVKAEFKLCAYALSEGDGTTPYVIGVEKTPRGEENALEKLFNLAKFRCQRSHVSAIGIVKKYMAISERDEAIAALTRGYCAMKKP